MKNKTNSYHSLFTILFSALFILGSTNLLVAQTCTVDLVFNSQTEIDIFSTNYPGCTVINGDVSFAYNSYITNLDGLSQITSISGDLQIHEDLDNDLLGLGNLTSV